MDTRQWGTGPDGDFQTAVQRPESSYPLWNRWALWSPWVVSVLSNSNAFISSSSPKAHVDLTGPFFFFQVSNFPSPKQVPMTSSANQYLYDCHFAKERTGSRWHESPGYACWVEQREAVTPGASALEASLLSTSQPPLCKWVTGRAGALRAGRGAESPAPAASSLNTVL